MGESELMQSLLKVGTFEENDYCDSCESEEDSQISYEMILPRSRYIQVPHVRQLCNWDCGLACVLMVLKTLGIDHYDINSLGELCSTTSIWTVDLAFLLHKLSVCFSFLTVTLEANPDFTREEFYKEQLPNDTSRVNSLFQIAMEMGIDIQCRSISDEEISELLLSGNHIAIALVDKHKLSVSSLRDVCDSVCCSAEPGYTARNHAWELGSSKTRARMSFNFLNSVFTRRL